MKPLSGVFFPRFGLFALSFWGSQSHMLFLAKLKTISIQEAKFGMLP